MDQTQNNQNTKKKKVKGPIRWEAILPSAIIVGLVVAYFVLFFDTHLKKAIEWGASRVHGAEVNIDSIKTSFLGGWMKVQRVQVTNSEKPEQNIVEIAEMNFNFSWDALLRAKFVVENASIDNFQVYTPRKQIGYVYPKSEKIKEEVKGGSDENALEKASQLIGKAIPTDNLTNIGDLKAQKRIEELQKELDTKKQEWDQSIKALPTQQDLQDLKNRITNIKIGGTNNIMEIQQQVQNITNLVQETNSKINQIKTTGEKLKSDVSGFQNNITSLNQVIQEDIKSIESKLQLPKLDAQSLAKQLFGPSFASKLSMAERYIEMAEKHMPPRKSKEQRQAERIQVQERAEGVNYEFPTTKSYPMFWLKRASLSSTGEYSAFSGDVSGEVTNATSNPPLVGIPTKLMLKGDFPKQSLRDIQVALTLDHTKDVASQSLKASVKSFPVVGRMLTEGDQVSLGFKDAIGSAFFEGTHRGGELSVKAQSEFANLDYIVKAQGEMQNILQNAVKEANRVDVVATAQGRFTDLKVDIRSNLASLLQKGFEKQISAKIAEAKKKIQDFVDQKIGSQKQALTQNYSSAQNQVNSQVESKKQEVENLKKQAEAKLNEAKGKAIGGGEQPLEDLKKKLGF